MDCGEKLVSIFTILKFQKKKRFVVLSPHPEQIHSNSSAVTVLQRTEMTLFGVQFQCDTGGKNTNFYLKFRVQSLRSVQVPNCDSLLSQITLQSCVAHNNTRSE